MEKYLANRPCPKCGSLIISDKYFQLEDFIKRTCNRCSYQWDESPFGVLFKKEKEGKW